MKEQGNHWVKKEFEKHAYRLLPGFVSKARALQCLEKGNENETV